MTHLLQKAFDHASTLAEEEQDKLAQWLIAELESERRWDQLLTTSEPQLEKLAAEAMAEHRLGKTRSLDVDAE